MINGVWIHLVLLLYNSVAINRMPRSNASGQKYLLYVVGGVIERESRARAGGGRLLRTFSMHTQNPSLGCSAESIFCDSESKGCSDAPYTEDCGRHR